MNEKKIKLPDILLEKWQAQLDFYGDMPRLNKAMNHAIKHKKTTQKLQEFLK